MIRLHQFPTPEGLPVSASPYCTKVELYLRLTGRAYETVNTPDPRKSPSKMVPFVSLPDGRTITDSDAIIEHFEGQGAALDEGLSAEERQRGKALVEQVDHPIYFSSLYARFGEPAGWVHQKAYISTSLPWLLRLFVPALVRKGQVARCASNGFADPSAYAKAVTALAEVSSFLGDSPYLSGDKPRVADCAIWAQLVTCMYTAEPTPPRDTARADQKLVAYLQRVADHAKPPLPPLN